MNLVAVIPGALGTEPSSCGGSDSGRGDGGSGVCINICILGGRGNEVRWKGKLRFFSAYCMSGMCWVFSMH